MTSRLAKTHQRRMVDAGETVYEWPWDSDREAQEVHDLLRFQRDALTAWNNLAYELKRRITLEPYVAI